MIEGNYIYVDKTELIYNLYATGDRYFFLSRPRRFGKSLLISTLKELFSGNKKLFQNLWIEKSGVWHWQEHPIIYLDFSALDHETAQEFKISLSAELETIAEYYEIALPKNLSVTALMRFLVRKLAATNKVVILIDEYDYPLLNSLDNSKIAQLHLKTLKNFFTVIKSLSASVELVFITGVSKFAKTSIFSGINNLIDLTMTPEAAALLGYTRQEIEYYFAEYITELAQDKQNSREQILHEIEQWYNGYRFSSQEIKVYNPFSVLYYLKTKQLANYWFESGTPSFLVHLLKTQYTALEDIQDVELSADSLGTFDIEHIPLIPLLFQTGYLSITNYDKETNKYKLGYPNTEVSLSFQKYLVVALTQNSPVTVERSVSLMIQALNNNNIDVFCELLQSLLAHIPYNLYIEQERYFHSLFQFLGSLLGLEVQSEIVTNRGRIDLVITTENYIYIFEFKFNTSPDVALKQIEDQKYYERYLLTRKHITLIGLAFNYKNKKLSLEWQTKILR